MKKIVLMFCCFLAISCLFTGCEETEVKKDFVEVAEGSQSSTEDVANARGITLSVTLTAAYEQGSTFQLTGKINENSCYVNAGDKYSAKWEYTKTNGDVWLTWAEKSAKCIGNVDRENLNTVGTMGASTTTYVKFRVKVYHKSGMLYGEGVSKQVTLKKPF